MKQILIAGFTKAAYMPYMNFYLESLSGMDIQIHLVSWKRDETPDINVPPEIICHQFNRAQPDESGKAGKIGNFLRYRKFVRHIIRMYTFDALIVLHSLPAVLIAGILLSTYRKRFILDYRDYTYEGFAPFNKVVKCLVSASSATFVSSDAFRKVLPKTGYIYTSHNLLEDSLSHRGIRSVLSRDHRPIRISFWGFIRHEEVNRQIILCLGNDSRFELHYFGREQQTAMNLKALCREEGYKNTYFHGAYLPQDRYEFAAQTDIIHNMYENDATTIHAMGNKYYDGIIFQIPQLCTKDSFMGSCVENAQVGKAVDYCSLALADEIFEYYSKMDWNAFERCCDMETDRVFNEYKNGKRIVRDIAR